MTTTSAITTTAAATITISTNTPTVITTSTTTTTLPSTVTFTTTTPLLLNKVEKKKILVFSADTSVQHNGPAATGCKSCLECFDGFEHFLIQESTQRLSEGLRVGGLKS